MLRLLYTSALYLMLPAIVLRLLYRSLRAPAYRRRMLERFGFFAAPGIDRAVWVHAVSVGEVLAGAPVIHHLLSSHPGVPVVVTTMTPTGSERVRALFGKRVHHVYAPYDMPDAIARFLRRVRPRLTVIMETEIWPNTVRACWRRGIPVLLANARLSDQSARGYARARGLTRETFARLTRVVAQSEADAANFRALGVPAKRLRVSGSIKFDISIGADLRATAQRLRQSCNDNGRRPVWIAASTHDGEDEQLLTAFQLVLQRLPSALLILVPRHPERFKRVAQLIASRGFSYQRRSEGDSIDGATQVLLGDTMGELLMLFGCADVAFVGGSLVPRGGHNSLEPAAWGMPIVNGPSDFNFAEVSRLLRESGGLEIAENSRQLAQAVIPLLASAELRRQRGDAARKVVESNRGALRRLLKEVDGVLKSE